LRTTTFNQSDSASLLHLWNRSSNFDQLDENVFYEKIWGDSDYCVDLGQVVLEDGEPVAMALGIVRQTVTECRGYIKLLAVSPKYRRQGLAQQLVQDLQDKLMQHDVAAIRVGESAPNYLFPGVDVRYSGAVKLFKSLGYEQVGRAHNLFADIDQKDFLDQPLEDALRAKGFEIRRATHEDAQVIDDLIARYWLAWRAEISQALQNVPISIHLAIKGEQVVGFSVYDSNNLGTGWFGPMGTRPEFQGIGIGRVLMFRCLQDIKTQGHVRATIAWVSPTRLYAKHADAKPGRTFIRYEHRLVSHDQEKEISRL